MTNYGKHVVKFSTLGDKGGGLKAMGFYATEVKKPLASVAKLVEQGNRVQFGPTAVDNFIENLSSGRKIPLEREGNTYTFNVEFKGESSLFGRQV